MEHQIFFLYSFEHCCRRPFWQRKIIHSFDDFNHSIRRTQRTNNNKKYQFDKWIWRVYFGSPIRVLILFCCCCCWFTARCRWCWINAINPSHWVRSTSRNKSVVCVHSFMKKKNSASTSQCYRRRHIHNFNYWNNFRKVATTNEKHSNRSDRPDNSRQCFTQNPFVWISTIKLPNH